MMGERFGLIGIENVALARLTLAFKPLTAAGLAIAMAGCASNAVITDTNWPQTRASVDGFDIEQSKRVLQHGLAQIKTRALEEPALDQFVITGLSAIWMPAAAAA